MKVLRSLAFSLLLFGGGGLLLVLVIPGLLLPRGACVWLARTWHSYVLGALRIACDITSEARGFENLPNEPCLVACKHQSAWETFMLPIVLVDASFVLKRELLRIPVYGWYLSRLGQVPIDRAGGAQALRRMVETARRHLAQGRSLVIFPEGTRTAAGQRHAYHPGVAALYLQLGVPVVPVALNSGLHWSRNAFVKHPGRIVMEFLPPIPPGLPRKAFMRELEAQIEAGTVRLCAETST
jgi:1-acyl-sn-glycerol-3-phosphate acyltransferase